MIRKAQPRDAKGVARIRIKGWQDAYKGIIKQETLDNMDLEKDTKTFYERFNGTAEGFIANTYVYEEDDTKEILGFTSFGKVFDLEMEGKYDSEIYALYIDPEYKRKGIGKSLIEFVKNNFKEQGHKTVILWCLKDNLEARKFYEKMGGTLVKQKEKKIKGQLLKNVCYKYDL